MSAWTTSPAVTALRVAGHLAVNRLCRTRVSRADEVPWSVAALTPAWWTAIMCRAHPGAEVVAFHAVGGSTGTHQRDRFVLEYNAAGRAADLPTAVFTKSLPTVVNRMIGGYNGTARAEGRFYVEIRPTLDIEAPYGYFSSFDRRTLAGINVLEDIATTRDAVFCDYRTTITRPLAESMVTLLARLHAHACQSPRLDREWRWLANFADWFSIGARKMRTEHYTLAAIDRMGDRIPATLHDRKHAIWPATVAASAIHRRGPRGLLHSDVHIGNWYRRGDDVMGLYDWQCAAQGHWSRDLAYALSAALRPEDRRAWERALLERYIETFAGLCGVRLDPGEAWDQYRRQMLHALWMWTITLCHSRWLPAMQPEETSREMIARIATAMVDLGSLDAVAGD